MCRDWTHHSGAHHFVMNGCSSLPPCPPFANVTLCKTICREQQRPHPFCRSRWHFQISFIISCHKLSSGKRWQVRMWKPESLKISASTWALKSFHLLVSKDNCHVWLWSPAEVIDSIQLGLFCFVLLCEKIVLQLCLLNFLFIKLPVRPHSILMSLMTFEQQTDCDVMIYIRSGGG